MCPISVVKLASPGAGPRTSPECIAVEGVSRFVVAKVPRTQDGLMSRGAQHHHQGAASRVRSTRRVA